MLLWMGVLAAACAVWCGVTGANCPLVSSVIIGNDTIPALGASGAVSALLLAFALLFPKHKILLFAVVPVPALAGALFFVALDVWGLIAQGRGVLLPIGHGAHLGGALCGVIFYATYLRSRMPRMSTPAADRQRPTVELTADEAADFDRIRTKLSREGPSALTPKERAFMTELRERALGKSED